MKNLLPLMALTLLTAPALAQQDPPAPTIPPPAAPTPAPTAPDAAQEPAPPEEDAPPQRPRLWVGPDFGFYFPTSDKARRAFGDKFFSYGFGLNAVESVSEKGRIAFDFTLITNRNAGSNVFLAPVGIAYARRFGSGDKVVPYAGASVNVYIANIQSRRNDFDIKSGLRGGFGGTVFTGLNFGRIAYVQARYNGITKLSGIDLSGLSVTTGVRFRF